MPRTRSLSRRQFIAGTVAATASGPLIATSASGQDQQAAPPALARNVKLGIVGLGGRGRWLAGLFRRHGGYDMHAVADYFPQVAEEQGTELGVDPARRFSGLSGYKRLIESGIEAIALEDLPVLLPRAGGRGGRRRTACLHGQARGLRRARCAVDSRVGEARDRRAARVPRGLPDADGSAQRGGHPPGPERGRRARADGVQCRRDGRQGLRRPPVHRETSKAGCKASSGSMTMRSGAGISGTTTSM